MSRPEFELADVIERFGKAFSERYHPNEYRQRVLNALSVCRKSALGGHLERCDCCGKERPCYNSCRNRHCPKCQGSKQAFWVEYLLETTLSVKHYHIVFTVPHELNTVCLLDSKWFYSQLFSSVWDTLRQFGYTLLRCGKRRRLRTPYLGSEFEPSSTYPLHCPGCWRNTGREHETHRKRG